MSEAEKILNGENSENTPKSTETILVEFGSSLEIGIADQICICLTQQGLANLSVLKPNPDDGEMLRRVRDFSPKFVVDSDDITETLKTKDLKFLRFFSGVALQGYDNLIFSEHSESEASDKLYFNIERVIESFGAKSDAYVAFTNYLADASEVNAENLVRSLTRRDGVVELLKYPLISRVIDDDFQSRHVFRNAIFRSDDPELHRSRVVRMDSLLNSAFREDGVSEEREIELWVNYINPLSDAVTLQKPNYLAIQDLVEFYRENTGEALWKNPNKETFYSQNDFEIYRSVLNDILEVAHISDNELFHELVAEYYNDESGSVSSQVTHLLLIAHGIKIYDFVHSNFEAWEEHVFPVDNKLKRGVKKLYQNEDIHLDLDPAIREAIKMLAYSDAETGPDEQEYLIKQCLNYLSLRGEGNEEFIKSLIHLSTIPQNISEIFNRFLGRK